MALIDDQDELRVARSFVSFMGGALGVDQSYAGEDGYAVNTPRRFQTIGPTGVGVEGQPISTAQNGALVIGPGLLLIGVAVLAFFALSK